MNRLRGLLSLGLLLVAVSSPLQAASVNVDAGGVMLAVPIPSGYTELTKQHGRTYAYYSRLVPPSNMVLASFIGDEAAAQASASPETVVTPLKRITIQMSKVAYWRHVEEADLAGIKDKTQKLNADQLGSLQERAKVNLGRVLTLIKEFSDLDVGLSLANVIPLPIHDESPLHFSYSMLMRASVDVGQGQKSDVSVVATCTVMVVLSRVIMMMTVADSAELESERAIQKELVRDIWQAND